MTDRQRITLMADWWPKACDAQGWKKGDKLKRLEVLSEAVGREITSANDLDSTDDIDAVKRHLGMLANNLTAAIETVEPERGPARRRRVNIEESIKLLGVYVEDAKGYVAEIIRDKFKGGSRVMPLQIEDLSGVGVNGRPSQLEQLQFTLARTIQAKRKAAGHSLHQMKLLANVECFCTVCKPRRPVAYQVPVAEPEMEGNPF